MRDINNTQKQIQLKKFLGIFKGYIVCLLETHVRQEKQAQIIQKLKPGWTCIDNYLHAALGRIWILFDPRVSISVFYCSSQEIHCHVYLPSLQKYFFLSVIYASNCELERRLLWADLSDIRAQIPHVPWLTVGDFNVIRNMGERSDFSEGMPCPSSSLDFQECLNTVDFLDLHHIGPHFTWTNKREDGLVAKKLDRFLGNP